MGEEEVEGRGGTQRRPEELRVRTGGKREKRKGEKLWA